MSSFYISQLDTRQGRAAPPNTDIAQICSALTAGTKYFPPSLLQIFSSPIISDTELKETFCSDHWQGTLYPVHRVGAVTLHPREKRVW